MWLFLINVRYSQHNWSQKKSKIISRSYRCQQAGIKFQDIFTFLISHRILLQYIYLLGHSRVVDKEGNKMWHRKEGMQSKNSSRCTFFCNSTFIPSWFLIKKKSTSKKKLTSASEITMSIGHKNIIIPLLWQFGLFINTCVSKNSIVL